MLLRTLQTNALVGCLIILAPFAAVSADATARGRIERHLAAIGAENYVIELNVKIPVPSINGADAVNALGNRHSRR